uniref:Uncharacterized protein n=1 Tax=Arundo donax TaxID=35708 RepID=A0A0A9F2Z8_ARUDO
MAGTVHPHRHAAPPPRPRGPLHRGCAAVALRECNKEPGYPCTVLAILGSAKEPRIG